MFTSNRVVAAPVVWSRQVVADGRVDAVVLNSGGANACTGHQGFQDTHRTAEEVAATLGLSAADVAVCSTGLIGELLPWTRSARASRPRRPRSRPTATTPPQSAIITTDTHAKTAAFQGDGWSVWGMAKGAGMLAPSLATMLVVLVTDAGAEAAALDPALRAATFTTFDRVDSDGCQSTNDTVLLMASGASGVAVDPPALTDAVTSVCADLARQLVADAEGAHHDIAIEVRGAASVDDALEVARSVARNNLFKCAIFGADPNWGRVLAAVGTTTAAVRRRHARRLDERRPGLPVRGRR